MIKCSGEEKKKKKKKKQYLETAAERETVQTQVTVVVEIG